MRVSDARTGLSDAKFVALLVERKIENTINYVVEGEVYVPSIVKEGHPVQIHGAFHVLRLNPDAAPVDPSRLYYKLRINGQFVPINVNGQMITANPIQGSDFTHSQAYSFGTTHIIKVNAYYDADDDGNEDDELVAKSLLETKAFRLNVILGRCKQI